MKKNTFAKMLVLTLSLSLAAVDVSGQKRPTDKPKTKPIVFAVLNNGGSIEPIAFIEGGKLTPASDGGDEEKKLLSFTKSYYQPKPVYRLVFGGVDAGTVTVKSFDPKAECVRNIAEVTVVSPNARLRGMIMALATNHAVKKGNGVRRLPTPAERTEVESLVRAEFTSRKVAAAAAKNLKFQNMTALDVDADGQAEIVGSGWVVTSPTERALLFFIAEKSAAGKYRFGYSNFQAVKQDEVMSGEIKAVDEGVYHEVLLDALEYNGDATAEIFTYVPSFEGAGFSAYARRGGKWVKDFEGSNYHCGY